MPACGRLHCMECRSDRSPRSDSTQQPGVVADRTDSGADPAPAAAAAVGGGCLAGLCLVACADSTHALALPRSVAADSRSGGGYLRHLSGPGYAHWVGRGGDDAAVAVHAEAVGDAQAAGRAGGDLSGLFYRRHRVPVQPEYSTGSISVFLSVDTGGGTGWPATDPGA